MITRLVAFFSRLGVCANTGAIAGALTGMFLGGYLLTLPHHRIALRDAAIVGVGVGMIDWLAVIFVLVAVGRYVLSDVFLSSFFTCIVASTIAACTIDAVRVPALSMLVGLLVGLIVGAILCRLCGKVPIGWIK